MRTFRSSFSSVIAAWACLTSLAHAQDQFAPHSWTPTEKAAMADKVRGEFVHAWTSYKKYAWGHDELQPISKHPHDWYGTSLEMTPVDALDTMILMGLKDQAKETRELIDSSLSFDKDVYVKAFEISIRLLGGLLSSYQLTGDPKLLALADDLGTRLMPIFNSPTGMPYVEVNLKTGAVRGTDTNPAEVGTYLLEFGTLSKLTHKPDYYQKAKKAVVEMYNRRSSLDLVGSGINIDTGMWTGSTSHIGGGIDSYLEYLKKCALLFGDKDCANMWSKTVAALNAHVAEDTPSGFWYGEADMNSGKLIGHRFGALAAFFPAVLCLDGQIDRAEKLENSAYRMWNLTGIEPEQLDYSTMTITSPGYPLRPEIIESAYYLHTYTKSDRYLDMGKTFVDDLVKYCRTDAAYAALSNVITKDKDDDMESFFFAETLKYCYLLFAPAKTLDLHKVVINTEAHPLRKSWK